MPRSIVIGLLAGLLIADASAQGAFAVIVVDPQQRRVAGAAASLVCDRQREDVTAGPDGRLVFNVGTGIEGCTVSVTHPGFKTFQEVVGDRPMPWRIELELDSVRQRVDVTADRNTAPLAGLSFGSTSLSRDQLRHLGNDTDAYVRYAKAVAGTSLRQDDIYVDGLAATSLPPAARIARIEVNGDPFSVEYSTSGRNRIHITTQPPDRQLRLNAGGSSLGAGGGSLLAPGLSSRSRALNLSVSGPVPRSPLAFSLDGSRTSFDDRQPILALDAVDDSQESPTSAPTGTDVASISGRLHYGGGGARATLAVRASSMESTNGSVGGLTLAEAGHRMKVDTQEVRLSAERASPRVRVRGGFVVDRTISSLDANSRLPGVTVLGSFTRGGNAITAAQATRTDLTAKAVIESRTGRAWRAGATLTRTAAEEFEQPNPLGVTQFGNAASYQAALEGPAAATWTADRGSETVRSSTWIASPFAEIHLLRRTRLFVKTGLRADVQRSAGVALSPRLFAAGSLKGLLWRGGAGLFVENLANELFVQALKGDGLYSQRFLATRVSLVNPDQPDQPLALDPRPVLMRLAPDLARPRDLVAQISIERPVGRFFPGAEYSWRAGRGLLGARRLGSTTSSMGWTDFVESNRRRREHRLHLRLGHAWKGQTVLAHYQWVHAMDDTDSPFSFPADQQVLGNEWARSADVSPHHVTVVGNFRLPSDVVLSIVATARSAAPYNITTGADPAANGLYTDRAGRPRNGGDGPTYRSVDLFASRRIRVPNIFGASGTKLAIDVGIRAQNLLNAENHLTLGSVLSSPTFGQPLSALPGRAMRVWFSFGT